MIKQLKTLVLAIGLVAGLSLASASFAAKPKEAAAPAAAAPAPEAAAPVAPPAPVAAVATAPAGEHDDNPYGLGALWAQGDIVAKGTLLILVLMSMGSWYVIITKFFEQSKAAKFAKAAQDSFWSAASLRQGADGLAEDSPFRFIAEKGLESANKHTGLLGAVDFNTGAAKAFSAPLATCKAACKTAWLCWPLWARLPHSWDCSARFGVSTTRWSKSVCRAKRRLTKWPAPWASL
jgi:biopolymer transport protein ExbB